LLKKLKFLMGALKQIGCSTKTIELNWSSTVLIWRVPLCNLYLIILRHSIVYALSMIWERFVVYVENYLGTLRCLCRKLFGNVLLSMYSQWFGDLSLSMCRQWFGELYTRKVLQFIDYT
jgi:hypothetical protein